MNTVITDADIFDIRNYQGSGQLNRDTAGRIAAQDGYVYMVWNGAIEAVATGERIFYPRHGFWEVSSLPFVGWKTGYSYAGKSAWLNGRNPANGFARIPLRR
jgi:hypothetical protein